MAGTTPNRSYPYPQSSDTIDVPGDIQDLAAAVDSDVAALYGVSYTNDPGAVQSGFSLWTNGEKGWLALGGKLVSWWIDLNNTSTLTATSGNLTDVTGYLLSTAYRPDADMYVPFSFNTGTVQGSGQINPDGTVVLQAATGSVAAGSHIRIQGMYLKA